jgi:hypothetical protein
MNSSMNLTSDVDRSTRIQGPAAETVTAHAVARAIKDLRRSGHRPLHPVAGRAGALVDVAGRAAPGHDGWAEEWQAWRTGSLVEEDMS